MVERRKDIIGYEGYYQVSDLGHIRSLPRSVWRYHARARRHQFAKRAGKVLKLNTAPNGYPYCTLSRDGVHERLCVHSAVAKAFLGPKPSDDHEVNHINGFKEDVRSSNLEWLTHSENQLHAYRVLDRKFARQRAVIAFDPDTGKSLEFAMVRDVVDLTGIPETCLRRRIGRKVVYKGFLWRFKDHKRVFHRLPSQLRRRSRPVADASPRHKDNSLRQPDGAAQPSRLRGDCT